MEKFARSFFSMPMMAIGMFVFMVSIGAATLLESKYDTQTAKIIIYNALWFEVLLAYLCINLVANIFNYRMFQRQKIAMLTFHVAFIVMIVGAGVTRFFGFEGMMVVREGETSDFIYSSDPYLWISASDGKVEVPSVARKMYLSEVTDNDFTIELDGFSGRKSPITVEYVDFRKNVVDSLVQHDSIQSWALEIMTNGMQANYLVENDFIMLGDVAMSFEMLHSESALSVSRKGNQLFLQTSLPMRSISMSELRKEDQSTGVSDSMYTEIPVDTLVPFSAGTLYMVAGQQFVFRAIKKHAAMVRMPSGRDDQGTDCLRVKVQDGEFSKVVELNGGMGAIPERVSFLMNGVSYQLEYGSMKFQLPFSIRCNDFQLERYPGSDQPSSFASEVTILDEEQNVTKNKRIFMNNVIDYRGYRFFQSGYDPDEGGTRLSVNHDAPGTFLSYLGYLLMGIGLILSFIAPGGRFRELYHKLKNPVQKASLILLLFTSASAMAQHDGHVHENGGAAAQQEPVYRVMSEEHSDEMASLLVLDMHGRVIPFHTLCDQILRKIYRNNTYEGLNAVQTVMSMHMYQGHWVRQPVLYVSSKSNLREKLGMKGDYISYADLTNKETGEFMLSEDYSKAFQKFESQRNEYDKRLIQLGEHYQVMTMVLRWDYMRIVPVASDTKNNWYNPLANELRALDTNAYRLAYTYLASLDQASKDGRYGQASDLLKDFKAYQRKAGKDVVPSEDKVELEISYNKQTSSSASRISTFWSVGCC